MKKQIKLRDLVDEAVTDHFKETDSTPDPQVLVDEIMESVGDFIRTIIE